MRILAAGPRTIINREIGCNTWGRRPIASALLQACYSPNASDSADGTETTETATSGVDGSTSGATMGDASDTMPTGSAGTDGSTGAGVCGDGVVDGDEVCDDGVNDGSYDGCAADCSALGPHCGDGEQNGTEACDDGDGINGNGCNNDCIVSGTVLWTEMFSGGAATSVDFGEGVDATPDGDIAIAGYVKNGNDWEAFARGYSPDGVAQWTHTYQSAYGDARGRDVVIADNGTVNVVGGTQSASNGFDIWVRRLSSQGQATWTETYDGSGGSDSAYGVALDGDGNVVVVGSERQNAAGHYDIWLRKFTPDGLELWTRTYDGGSSNSDQGFGVAIDANDNIIVTGETFVEGEDDNIWIRKYDGNGGAIWTRTYNGTQAIDDRGNGVAVDPSGNILLSGTLDGANIWVAKYDPDGTLQWSETIGGGSSIYGGNRGVASDSDGNVIAAGSLFDEDTFTASAWVAKYAPDGTEMWADVTGEGGGESYFAGDVTVDGADNVVVVGMGPYCVEAVGIDCDIWVQKYAP